MSCRMRGEALFDRAWLLVALAVCLLMTACTELTRLPAVPADLQHEATVLGRKDLRYWAADADEGFAKAGAVSIERERSLLAANGLRGGALPPSNLLAISGGGENGAFGAGLLCAWSVAGTRPVFKGVTGISTGALTAPFAFLGSAYDDRLREVYTTLSAKDILTQRSYLAAYMQDAAADTAPLQKTIAKYVDQTILDAIAEEHAKGRILLIGTTNLDAREPIIWNIGEIAASGRPGALELVQKILLASAALPGAFPPVLFDVQVDGKTYQELHVDGGASAQVFVYPPSLDIRKTSRELGFERERNLYVIRNARLDPDWAQTERWTLSILGRAVSSLIQTQGVGDLYRIYLAAQRDGFDYNLAFIPRSFTTPLKEPFDTTYMRDLFQVGYDMAVIGYPWAKLPPGYAAPEVEPPPEPPQPSS